MNKVKLTEEVSYELSQLKHLAEIAGQLAGITPSDRKTWEAAAAAKYISDLVLGLENICKRRNAALDRRIPEGPEYHQNLLEDFLQDSELGKKLSPEIALRLKKYLRFRHRFIHGYGHQIDWEIIDEPLRFLPETVEILTNLWEKWLQALK